MPQGEVDTEAVLSHDKSRERRQRRPKKARPAQRDLTPGPASRTSLRSTSLRSPLTCCDQDTKHRPRPLSQYVRAAGQRTVAATPPPTPHPAATPLPRTHLGAPHRTAPFSSALDRADLSAHARRRPRPTSTRLRAAHPERPASRRCRLWACALAPGGRPVGSMG